MSTLFYESATVAYDSVKGYFNPQTNEVYGANPPVGAWRGPGDPLYKSGVDQTNYGSTNANQQSAQQAATQTIVSTCAALTDPSGPYVQICKNNNAPMPNLKVSTNATQQTPTPGESSVASSVSSLFSGNKGLLLIGAIVIGAIMMMGGEGKYGYD